MKEIEILAARRKFTCTNEDEIATNGAIIWLDTQKYFHSARWPKAHPLISKTELKRLKKLGVLSETERNGLTIYKFQLN